MMATMLAAFLLISLLFAAMAVGVIFSNKPIKGSCGGLNALGMKEGCEICGGDPGKCDELSPSAVQPPPADKVLPRTWNANRRTF